MTLDTIAQLGSVATGAVAAGLWLWSALVRMPREIRKVDHGWIGEDKPVDDLDRLTTGLVRQSHLSAWAAGLTAASVALQALHAAISSCA
jgi:hypothetical protein